MQLTKFLKKAAKTQTSIETDSVSPHLENSTIVQIC